MEATAAEASMDLASRARETKAADTITVECSEGHPQTGFLDDKSKTKSKIDINK